jgi:hypothetical protein
VFVFPFAGGVGIGAVVAGLAVELGCQVAVGLLGELAAVDFVLQRALGVVELGLRGVAFAGQGRDLLFVDHARVALAE